MRSALREKECTVSRDVSRDEGDGNPAGRGKKGEQKGKSERATKKRCSSLNLRAWEKLNLKY